MKNSKNVRLKNIFKQFVGDDGNIFTAVKDVNIDIKDGELVTLLGPSGCGKTTTLRMIAGFEIPTSGNIFIGEDDITNLPPDKRDTSMVFQSYAIFPHLNIYENVAYGLKIKKLSKKEINKKVNSMLELVGLKGLAKRAPSQLSGGQQQRVALARALVMEPSVLLFDEPLSNLDAKLRVYMRTEIRNLQKKIGITSIYVTHDQAEAMSMSDRVIIMNKGVVEQIGTPQQIYKNPANEFVADFIGEANIIKADIIECKGNKASINMSNSKFDVDTNLKLGIDDKIKVVIRPEAIKLSDEGKYKVKIKSSVFMGAYQDYRVDYEGLELKIVDYDPSHKKVYTKGDTAFLNLNGDCMHIILSND